MQSKVCGSVCGLVLFCFVTKCSQNSFKWRSFNNKSSCRTESETDLFFEINSATGIS